MYDCISKVSFTFNKRTTRWDKIKIKVYDNSKRGIARVVRLLKKTEKRERYFIKLSYKEVLYSLDALGENFAVPFYYTMPYYLQHILYTLKRDGSFYADTIQKGKSTRCSS